MKISEHRARDTAAENQMDYSDYFFNVAQKKGDWKSWKSHKDNIDRCKDCGMRIDEHRAATTNVMPATASDILRANQENFEFEVSSAR